MGQGIKYAALGVALGIIIVSIIALVGQVLQEGPLNEFSNNMASVIGNQGLISGIQNVRGAINYFFGAPFIISLCIWSLFVLPVIKVGLQITITVIRFINQ